jgi:inhibitor of KinA sporulation pathway (predicted exonuclease)
LKTTRLNIIDLEATCVEDRKANPDFISEIIEIGIVQVAIPTFEILHKDSIFVKPQYSEITEFCTQLTTITPDKVKSGRTMEQAFEFLFDKYKTKKYPWGSWGAYDYFMFNKMYKLYNIDNPMATKHINLKLLFALYHGLNKEFNVEKALKHANLEFEGTPHRGIDDALNAKRLAEICLKQENPHKPLP